MKLLGRLQSWLAGKSAPAGADTLADPRPLAEFLRVVEVADATAAAGELFQRKFKHPIPDYPRHFIMQYEPAPGKVETIGYVHYLAFENCWLCGGMCIDGMAQRRMPREHREKIRAGGSLAETMLRESFRLLQHDLPSGYDLMIVVRPHRPMAMGEYREMLLALAVKLHRRLSNDDQRRGGE